MAKKNENPTQTEIANTPARKARTVKPKSETVIALETQLKEAKKIAKVMESIPALSSWGCDQIGKAIQARRDQLANNQG